MSEDVHIPQAIASNTLRIGGLELTVHVLDNGQRVIDMESFERFIDALHGGPPWTEDEVIALAKVIKGIE